MERATRVFLDVLSEAPAPSQTAGLSVFDAPRGC
jgi:hypothetical protein